MGQSSDNIKSQYRPSASLILAGKHSHNETPYDYSLLLVKRTERTSYAPNHCVFPGGVFDSSADASIEWLTYFESFGVSKAQLELLNSHQVNNRPKLLTNYDNCSLPRDIALRINALRETFEEVGLLLCRSSEHLQDLESVQSAQVFLKPFEHTNWQQRVHNDAHQFLQLCRHLQVVPDLWALNEWALWRTAATSSRKFDTIYYLAGVESTNVPLLLEPNEIISAHWLHPLDCWQSSQQAIIWLPYMLMYEMARLMNVHSWLQLLQFAQQRGRLGSTTVQPVFYRCNDCMFCVLPGDELYLTDSDKYSQAIAVTGSIDKLQTQTNRYNRCIIYDFHEVDIVSNVEPLDGHLPVQAAANIKVSKL